MGLIVALTQGWLWGVKEWMLVKPWAECQLISLVVGNIILIVIVNERLCRALHLSYSDRLPSGAGVQAAGPAPLPTMKSLPPSLAFPGPAHSPIPPSWSSGLGSPATPGTLGPQPGKLPAHTGVWGLLPRTPGEDGRPHQDLEEAVVLL